MRLQRFLLLPLAGIASVCVLAAGCTTDDSAGSSTTKPAGGDSFVLDDATKAELSALIEENLGAPGGTVGVFSGDERWVTVHGDAQIPTPGPEATPGIPAITQPVAVTEGLVWPLRSITKSFTVTILLQLVDEGVVSLDDTIEQYVPGLPNGDSVTLEQLAAMTSGLPEYTNQAWVDAFSADPLALFTGPQLIGFAETEPAQFAPGAEHVYTNTNTVLLGQVIEKATGSTFADELGRRILEPLGLERTVYPAGVADWNGDHATGYQLDGGLITSQVVNFSVFDTAGAMISDVDDLAVWGKALATGSLISAESQALRTDASARLSEGPEYDGYGLGIGTLDGWWGHTGEGMGFESLVMYDAEQDITVVIYVNQSNQLEPGTENPIHPPTKLFRQIAELLG